MSKYRLPRERVSGTLGSLVARPATVRLAIAATSHAMYLNDGRSGRVTFPRQHYKKCIRALESVLTTGKPCRIQR